MKATAEITGKKNAKTFVDISLKNFPSSKTSALYTGSIFQSSAYFMFFVVW